MNSDNGENKTSNGSLLVVNMRGLVNTRAPVRKTLQQLHLLRRFNSTLVPDTQEFRGMLIEAKEHVAWCKADAELIEKLLRSRAEKSTGKKASETDLAGSKKGLSFGELAKQIESGSVRLDGSQGMRNFFRLAPPKGGFKRSTRRQYSQGGILGPNKELTRIVEKMI